MDSNIHRAEELRYPQVRDLDRDKTLFILPVSALEVHGHHLPLGMDVFFASMNASDFAQEFARARPDWAVVLYPPLTLGTDELPLQGSVSTSPRVLRDAVMGFGRSLAIHGFKYIVVTNGHGGARQPPALEEACQRISRKYGIAMISPSMKVLYPYPTGGAFSQIEGELGRKLTEIERTSLSTGGEHAAIMETSLLLSYRPELVTDDYKECKMDGPPHVPAVLKLGHILTALIKAVGLKEAAKKLELVTNGLSRNIGWWLNARRGYGEHQVTYMGNPSAASAELGGALRRLVARDLLKEIDDVITGRTLPSEVHSLFWTMPILRTDFLRNLGIVVGALIVIILIILAHI